MYDIRALVGEETVIDAVARLDPRFCWVRLALGPFALLPIDVPAVGAMTALWPPVPLSFQPFDRSYLESVADLLKRISMTVGAPRLAYVEAGFFGGAGQGIGLGLVEGVVSIFDEPNDQWPDTNMSCALKSIGVPERLEKSQDAFDVLDLGRVRRVGDWRKR